MICLRCGHCCRCYLVVVVVDPELGPVEGNLLGLRGDGSDGCPHLQGDTPEEYSCAIHNYPWFGETPCGEFGQVEATPDSECRVGRWMIDKWEKDNEGTEDI